MFTHKIITIVTEGRGVIHSPRDVGDLIEIRRESGKSKCILQRIGRILQFLDKGIFIRRESIFDDKNTTRLSGIKCETEKLLFFLDSFCYGC